MVGINPTSWFYSSLLSLTYKPTGYWHVNFVFSMPTWLKIISGDSRNFVQGVPISFWKNFGSFRSISDVSGRFVKYRPKFKIWPAWNLCLKKKKKVLKTKTNLDFAHRKTSKRKKKEMKWNEQRYLYNKLLIHLTLLIKLLIIVV